MEIGERVYSFTDMRFGYVSGFYRSETGVECVYVNFDGDEDNVECGRTVSSLLSMNKLYRDAHLIDEAVKRYIEIDKEELYKLSIGMK